MEELKITKERILEAASKCGQAKETLKTLFPEAFTNEPFLFNEGTPITASAGSDNPLPFFIGLAVAPPHLKGKCLIVKKNKYDVVVESDSSFHIISFISKSSY